MQRAPKFVLVGVLAGAVLLEGAVLYFMDDPTLRLYVGLALFLLIGWILASSQVAEMIEAMPGRKRKRRYPKMRVQVELLLAEVSRLNGMAVDENRGFRNSEEAVAEMDAIEERMKDIVGAIRREAGVVSDVPDPEPALGEAPESRPPDERSESSLSAEASQSPLPAEPSEGEE